MFNANLLPSKVASLIGRWGRPATNGIKPHLSPAFDETTDERLDPEMTDISQQFASDNYAGIRPEALAAITEANSDHQPAYGGDAWTAKAADAFRALFETKCEVFFAFNGTAANSLALAEICQSYHSVICSDAAHVETDECGAPEFFSNGSKLLVSSSADGELTPEAVCTIATMKLPSCAMHPPLV